MVRNDFNKVHVGENKKGKVCCKYRPTFYYKKNKLILQKILQKYDSEITILLSCKYCVRLSERGRKRIAKKTYERKNGDRSCAEII